MAELTPGGPDWGRLGLRGNPFENVAPGERLEWVDVPPEVAAAVAAPRFRVELVGPKGAGKSTLLRALLARLGPHALRYLAPGQRLGALPSPLPRVFAVDEADRAAASELRQLGEQAERAGTSLLLGTHLSLADLVGGEVRSFELSALPALGWVDRRVASARLPGANTPDFGALARRLAGGLGGVNYLVLRALYELCEDAARGAPVDEALITRAQSRASGGVAIVGA